MGGKEGGRNEGGGEEVNGVMSEIERWMERAMNTGGCKEEWILISLLSLKHSLTRSLARSLSLPLSLPPH